MGFEFNSRLAYGIEAVNRLFFDITHFFQHDHRIRFIDLLITRCLFEISCYFQDDMRRHNAYHSNRLCNKW